jgi:ribosomal-protein-alanine N-acetyltransferase
VTGPFVIEPLVGPADLDGVQAVDEASFPSPWTREMYEAELGNVRTSFILVGRSAEAAVAGYCSYRLVADELQINNVAVGPAHRGQGLGRALVHAAAAHGRRAGARIALLEVRGSNANAQRLYLRLGFRQVGRRPRYYEHPEEDALIFAADVRDLGQDPAA